MMPVPVHAFLFTYLLSYVLMITDWKALFCLLLFSKRKSCFVCFHSSPVSLNICFQGVELLSAIPPKTFCSPEPAPSTEMTFSEVSNDLSQAKAKTQRCTLLFTRHGFFLSSFHFYDCCLLPLSWLLWKILLILQLVGGFHQLVALLLSCAVSIATPV